MKIFKRNWRRIMGNVYLFMAGILAFDAYIAFPQWGWNSVTIVSDWPWWIYAVLALWMLFLATMMFCHVETYKKETDD